MFTSSLLITFSILRHCSILWTHLLSKMHQLQPHWLLTHFWQVLWREQSKKANDLETKSLLVSELLTDNGTRIWSILASIVGRWSMDGVIHARPFSKTSASMGVELPKTQRYLAFSGSGRVRIINWTWDSSVIGILSGTIDSKSIHCCPLPRESQRAALVSFWQALRTVQRFSNEHHPQNGSRDSKHEEQFV